MKKNKKNSIVGIIITILILIFLVVVSNIKPDTVSKIGNPFTKFVNSIQNGMTYLKNKVAGNNSFFVNVDELKKENDELKAKNSELEKSLREFEVLKAENSTLREYVNLTDKYSEYTTYPAYVIQSDISNYSKIIVINAGKKDGIDVNMTVISEKGLVGHVVSVTDDTAKVQTIIDTSSSVASTISTSRDSIALKGIIDSNNELKAAKVWYIEYDKGRVSCQRIALFKSDKLIDVLDEETSKGILLIYGEAKNLSDSAKLNDCTISYKVSQAKSNVNVEIKNNKPVFSLNLDLDLDLYGADNIDRSDEIKAMLENRLASLQANAINFCIKKYGCDIFNFHRYIMNSDSKFFKANLSQMENIIQSADYNATIDIKVKYMGSNQKISSLVY